MKKAVKFFGNDTQRRKVGEKIAKMDDRQIESLFSSIAEVAQGESISHEMEIRLSAANDQWSVEEKKSWMVESCDSLHPDHGKPEEQIGTNGGKYSVVL